jgi:transposase InsO family protein
MSSRESKTPSPPDKAEQIALPKAQVQVSSEALFRYQVVSDVRSRRERDESLSDSVKQVASRQHAVLTGGQRRVSKRTLYRWLSAFESGGLAGLEPQSRKSTGNLALTQDLLEFLQTTKQDDSKASVPEVLRRAREQGVLAHDQRVDRTTAYRACVRLGLPLSHLSTKRDRDARRFSYPHRMMMMLVDGKHFRAGAKRARRVAFFFLDDCTRKGLHVVVGTKGEATQLFLRGLYELILKYGLAAIIYLDNGPAFIADDAGIVIGQSGMHLVLGTSGYPEGHGKVERFNRTASSTVLRALTRPEVDPSVPALELRLQHFLHEQYNRWPHESLNGQTPEQRWQTDSQPLRFPSSETDLRERFFVTETRRVSNDHVISFEGTAYEVPRGHATTRATLRRAVLDDSLYVLHQGQWTRLHPVDLTANAYARRARPGAAAPEDDQGPPPVPTAACQAFDRDFGPVVDADGNCPAPTRASNSEPLPPPESEDE